ncbi:G-type lectin S-receptor-like serine/threonine-protein kinase RLK1 [Acorus calamus]|uniref:Receptor-like serine/threonine-protein kinase n=1 Tax=Acorus calamus TaxID=4465 RepID=A0AAV9CEB0_ACOCL|nr:G-type lectin S-receptor-like serine/threonine-protein kinase RLK1 [Acorus calamus]
MILTENMISPLCSLHVVLFILIISPLTSTAQTHANISLGSSLSTPTTRTSITPSWTSPSGEFAFGFRPLSIDTTTQFILAIYFNTIPEKTIIWSANGDNPAQTGSKVTLTLEGRLNLTNPTGQEIWTSHEGGGAVTHAAMLDNGNFVLATSNSSNNAWESFDQPTDTILPSQELSLGSSLQARLTETGYSPGRFTLQVQTDGNLDLYYIDRITKNNYDHYWDTNTVGSGVKLVFDVSGSVYFALKNNSVFNVTESGVSAKDYYQRATLDPDGVFRQYIYPKTNMSSRNNAWSLVDSVASDICTNFIANLGSGVCGFNSYCKPNSTWNTCECPTGYSFFDEELKYKGCKPDFTAQSCDVDESRMYQLEEMFDTDWPDGDYEQYNPIGEDQCRSLCLDDCFCAVAIFRQGKALIKVSIGNSTTSPPPHLLLDSNGRHKDRRALVIVGLLGSSAFLNIIFISAILMFLCSYNKFARTPRRDMSILEVNLRSFSYKELEEATDKFREELGRGAFGIVYKGVLNSSPGIQVAVKKLDKMEEEVQKEFENEVTTIGRTHHKNLVRLLGFCNEGPNRLLVYEFMSHGSLMGYLSRGGPKPEWHRRLKIAFGIARGITYLHEECRSQIIHCDIKPHNILLDDSLEAKISDFGLAKLLKTDQTRTNTGIRGTKGYVAPEWFKKMAITAKVDVYSFGVMLLEIVCCRKNVELEMGNEEATILTDWAYDCYRQGRLDALVNDDEEVMSDLHRFERFLKVAIWCIQEDPSLRPPMKKVSQMLEGAVEVAVPPDPSSFISSIN